MNENVIWSQQRTVTTGVSYLTEGVYHRGSGA